MQRTFVMIFFCKFVWDAGITQTSLSQFISCVRGGVPCPSLTGWWLRAATKNTGSICLLTVHCWVHLISKAFMRSCHIGQCDHNLAIDSSCYCTSWPQSLDRDLDSFENMQNVSGGELDEGSGSGRRTGSRGQPKGEVCPAGEAHQTRHTDRLRWSVSGLLALRIASRLSHHLDRP